MVKTRKRELPRLSLQGVSIGGCGEAQPPIPTFADGSNLMCDWSAHSEVVGLIAHEYDEAAHGRVLPSRKPCELDLNPGGRFINRSEDDAWKHRFRLAFRRKSDSETSSDKREDRLLARGICTKPRAAGTMRVRPKIIERRVAGDIVSPGSLLRARMNPKLSVSEICPRSGR
jgi:hypothetical protein